MITNLYDMLLLITMILTASNPFDLLYTNDDYDDGLSNHSNSNLERTK